MQIEKGVRSGWKPMAIAVGLMAGTSVNLYADVDQFSQINTVLNSRITSQYINSVDNFAEMAMSDRRKFYNHYETWEEETRYLSSVNAIINQQDFLSIVSMGPRAVPYIVEVIKTRPSTLVWALNMIFQRKITSNPNATIVDACKLWVKELSK